MAAAACTLKESPAHAGRNRSNRFAKLNRVAIAGRPVSVGLFLNVKC
jgi:hypothetical protein